MCVCVCLWVFGQLETRSCSWQLKARTRFSTFSTCNGNYVSPRSIMFSTIKLQVKSQIHRGLDNLCRSSAGFLTLWFSVVLCGLKTFCGNFLCFFYSRIQYQAGISAVPWTYGVPLFCCLSTSFWLFHFLQLICISVFRPRGMSKNNEDSCKNTDRSQRLAFYGPKHGKITK